MTAEEKEKKFERNIKDTIRQHDKDWDNAREEFMKGLENLVKNKMKGLITEEEFMTGIDDKVMEYNNMMNLCYSLIDKANKKLSILEDIEMMEQDGE